MKEKTTKTTRAFDGRLLKVDVLEVELENGQKAHREIIRHPGAVVVLGRLPGGDYVFVRQYRKAIDAYLVEAVAGTLNTGEDPDACARRELAEETGYTATAMTKLGVMVPAPGYTEERLHVYFADLHPERGAMAPDEDEKVHVVLLKPDEVEDCLKSGPILDAKTLAAWWLFRNGRTQEGL
jgi:ADP-ribose pyrophosphatase